MKFLLTIGLLCFTHLTLANSCPDLSGSYHCLFSAESYSLLVIEQKSLSDSEELIEYSFNLTAIPGDPDLIQVNTTGIQDQSGWINKCSNGKILSLFQDGSSLSEVYLDQERAFLRRMNGSIVQKCPRKL